MAFVLVHLFAYLSVNGMLVVIWLLTNGSVDSLTDIVANPTTADKAGFWPVWPIVIWGALVVFHVGAWLSTTLFGRKAWRRREARFRWMARRLERRQEARLARAEGGRRSRGQGRRRQWVTVLFTDIANSTDLTEHHGDDEWSQILAEHRSLVRDAVALSGGDEVGTTGDGHLARFSAPIDAVQCAVDIQRRMGAARDEGRPMPHVRIGLHSGEVVEHDDDLIGRVVNLAARVMGAAEPGEILVTEPVADELAGRITVADRGLVELKGVPRPRHLLSVSWSDSDTLGGERP